mmetsp:Transcript_17053/g.35976  ORF Transcript_17053/g.35976 Transcript_17053/m.35976 type:complete len:110 (-) Transcript_17053:95-424(-)
MRVSVMAPCDDRRRASCLCGRVIIRCGHHLFADHDILVTEHTTFTSNTFYYFSCMFYACRSSCASSMRQWCILWSILIAQTHGICMSLARSSSLGECTREKAEQVHMKV